MKFRFEAGDFEPNMNRGIAKFHEVAAALANAKLDAHLATLPRVVGQIKNIDGGLTDTKVWCATQIPNTGETHTALLWDPMPIEKLSCEHPIEHITIRHQRGEHYHQCELCGAKLKATWSKL